jgi:hypothetical protein
MSAATQSVNTPGPRTRDYYEAIPVAANVNVYNGVIAAVDAAGNLNPASDTAALHVLGRAEGIPETIDTGAIQLMVGQDAINNPGAAGAITCNVRRGIFAWANSGANPVTKAMVRQACYVQDSQTVCDNAGSTNKIVAGVVIGIDPTTGLVWVDTGGRSTVGLTPTGTAATDIATLFALLG